MNVELYRVWNQLSQAKLALLEAESQAKNKSLSEDLIQVRMMVSDASLYLQSIMKGLNTSLYSDSESQASPSDYL